jgi:16S rRNA (uracil1498-N3)-methyltransferase
MRVIRIHTGQPLAVGAAVDLESGPSRHLLKVLRFGVGDRVVLLNGDGAEYEAAITAIEGKGRCRLKVDRHRQPTVESALDVTLFQAIARGEKMDWCIQKAVELGVTRIQPVFTERTGVRLSETRADKRLARWQQIAIAACEQSGRVRVPEVLAPLDLERIAPGRGLDLVLDPCSNAGLSALDAPAAGTPVRLLVGPEGGLSEVESQRLADRGWIAVRFGPRVLRTETAGIAVLAALQSLWGDAR